MVCLIDSLSCFSHKKQFLGLLYESEGSSVKCNRKKERKKESIESMNKDKTLASEHNKLFEMKANKQKPKKNFIGLVTLISKINNWSFQCPI